MGHATFKIAYNMVSGSSYKLQLNIAKDTSYISEIALKLYA